MYRFIDHTADIAFEVEAESLEKLIEDATVAFYSAFTYLDRIDESEVMEVVIEEESPDTLLFSWLNELLYIFDTHHFAGREVEVRTAKNDVFRAQGIIRGGKLSPEKVRLEPKAITLHNFRVEKTEKGWRAFVVVDI